MAALDDLHLDPLVDLPPELGLQIMLWLDGPALARGSCVSRAWRRVCGDLTAWRSAYQRQWPKSIRPAAVVCDVMSWREAFAARWRLEVRDVLGIGRAAAADEATSLGCPVFGFAVGLHSSIAKTVDLSDDDSLDRLLVALELCCEASDLIAEDKKPPLQQRLDIVSNTIGRVYREAAEHAATLRSAMLLFDHCDAVYASSAAALSDGYWVRNNWALALKARAHRLASRGYRDAQHYLARACTLCFEAIAMRQGSQLMLANYGRMLREHALQWACGSETRLRLMTESWRHYMQARALAATVGPAAVESEVFHQALNNVGRAYRDLGIELRGRDLARSDEAFRLSAETYDAALSLRPNHRNSQNNRGVTFLAWGALSADATEREGRLGEARAAFESLLSRMDCSGAVTSTVSAFDEAAAATAAASGIPLHTAPGDDSYDSSLPYHWALYSMARLHATVGEHAAAEAALRLTVGRTRMSAETLRDEDRFATARGMPWFERVVSELAEAEATAMRARRYWRADADCYADRFAVAEDEPVPEAVASSPAC